ncbi:MAG: hypothetical protein AB8G14_11255 [Ilumatobacter sp.]
MTRQLDNQNRDEASLEGVEHRILEDDQRRSGEFLRDFLSRHRVDAPDSSVENPTTGSA